MRTFSSCVVVDSQPIYDSSGTYTGDFPIPAILETREVDHDPSSIFMCTQHRQQNSVFHQKMKRLGRIIPQMGLWKNKPTLMNPSGTMNGDHGSYVIMWGSIPLRFFRLRCFWNQSYYGSGNIYMSCSVKVGAVGPQWISQTSASWKYYDKGVTFKYTKKGDYATKNEFDFSQIPEHSRYIFENVYMALPSMIYKDSPQTNRDLEQDLISCYDFFVLMARFRSWEDYPSMSYPGQIPQLYDLSDMKDMSLFGEPLRFQGYPIFDLQNYWFNLARQRSFLDACQSVPRLNDNMISNILEITSFIYNLVVKHKIEIPKSLSDAWLAYRYQYTTTKLDTEEAIKFVNRHLPSNVWDVGYEAYGMHNFEYGGTSVVARCTTKMKRKEVDKIHELWISLTKYGLAPNFYVLWDMVPFSFIADWFIPIGDALSANALGNVYTEENYEFEYIVYSLKYSRVDDNGIPISVYYRWVEDTPPDILGYYWFEKDKTSNKTICKRIADTLSLLS